MSAFPSVYTRMCLADSLRRRCAVAPILPCRPPVLCSQSGCGGTSFDLDLESHGPFLRVYDEDGHSLKAMPWWICSLCAAPYFYAHWRQHAEDLRFVTRISGDEDVLLLMNGVAGDYVLGSLSRPEILYALPLFEHMQSFRLHAGRRAGTVTAFLTMYNARFKSLWTPLLEILKRGQMSSAASLITVGSCPHCSRTCTENMGRTA